MPVPGDEVLVRTHFRARGGYVDHHGLLLWATPAGGMPGDAFTPGTPCTVVAVHVAGGDVDLEVTR
jgi:hypothetical protein